MVELYDEFFSMLRLAKRMYECEMAGHIKEWLGSYELGGDNYWELACASICWVFQDTRHYYNERNEIETWLFMDPVIDRFCQLCQRYEELRGICEKDNRYRWDMAQTIHEEFCFSSYSYGYDWRLSAKDRGRRCLLLFTSFEFYGHDEIFEGLSAVRDGFKAMNERMKKELSKETGIIPLSLVAGAHRKEAA